ncbi:MAG: tRNA uridine-5-carboxymethylaminomethyl(34) synthesis GTPase MnmE [Bacteroidales bacterium]|nr:tRNA uridine-5-carboxymethylaminomethyl(34) synthesis GTPase MnmE [Bacteroidales bacterium]
MKNLYSDTIVAPATIPGTGAISIIRVSGPEAFSAVDAVVSLKSGTISEADGYTIHFGEVSGDGDSLLDTVLVSVFRAPHSYTGEDSVEISTHASTYIVSELIRLLIQVGCRMAGPGEFTKRAFLNGKMDLAQAEAVADVISSTTEASHRIAMNQLRGGFSKELEGLRSELLEMASLLELELDFSEEDVEFANREKLIGLVEGTLSHVEKLAASFRAGNMIKSGIPVAIVGAVNAGKSSLLNALLGDDRAIVSSVEGTTRDTIEEILQVDGLAYRFIDTAGIRVSKDSVEKIGIERTYQKISTAEVVFGVLDCSQPEPLFKASLELLLGKTKGYGNALFLLLNKADKLSQNDINNFVTLTNNIVTLSDIKAVILPVSAKTGFGLEALKQSLSASEKALLKAESGTLVTNLRHYEALTASAHSLRATAQALRSGIPTDLVAEDLRAAIASVNLILGHDLGLSPESVLHDIFAHHCIGK